MLAPSRTVRIYCSALIGLTVAFAVVSLVAGAFRQATISQSENRALAQLPELPRTLAQLGSYPQRFDAYFNDNFGLRKLLLRLNSNVNTVLLGRSPSDKVIIGKDSWLFYAGEESIELYRNQRPLSSLQIEDARAALELRRRAVEDKRARYLFVVAPDKHSIYPEKMPSFMSRRDAPSQLDQLVAMAEAAGLPVLDLRPALRQGKTEGLTYFKDDTHWTDWGAYLGYREIMTRLQMPDLPMLQLEHRQFSIPAQSRGELAGMAELPWRESTTVLDPAANRCQVASEPLRQIGPRWSARWRCPSAPRKLLWIGDSFTDRIMPFIAQSFGEVVYHPRSGFTPLADIRPYLDAEAPDLVIEELVERHAASIAESLRAEPRKD